jgi:hypothetical protein
MNSRGRWDCTSDKVVRSDLSKEMAVELRLKR